MLEKLVSNKPFQYKKLTEAEQKARGILGRLVGVIADTENPTRNGRHYSERLWENVFENPIMKEKIANRCCFGELNHPADRTETDMEKVAICLAEPPKKGKDGKLYGVFDILDTPCGRILKALCNYGCKIGISSRGQGDLIPGVDGEEVDPDTYECECFDAVLVPGVTEARLNYMNESLDSKNIKRVIRESFKTAKNDNEIRIMEEQFKNLNLINESDEDKKASNDDVIEISDSNVEINVEDDDKDAPDDGTFGIIDGENDDEDTKEESAEEELVKEESIEVEENDESSNDEAEIFLNFLANNFEEDKIRKVCKILDIEIEGEEETEENKEEESTEEAEVEETEESEEESTEEAESDENTENAEEETEKTETSEAKDPGSKLLVDSLKEALRAKCNLEAEMRTLQEKLAASDTRVNELTEEGAKQKSAISRLSLIAESTKDLRENTSKLEEALAEKEQVIESQKTRIQRLVKSRKESLENANSISESLEQQKSEVKKLNEDLTNSNKNYEIKISEMNEALKTSTAQLKNENQKLNENLTKATKLKEGYKKLANNAINKFIELKAETLGVTSKDIKRKLGESYTIEDVEAVCEDLKAYQLNVSKLPFNVDKNVSIKGVKVNEANANKASSNKAFDDDSIDDVLFKMANIDD